MSLPSGDEDDTSNKYRGLVGLQNLGNTCYMNAVLQALSNCQQLTRFVLECPDFSKETGLSHSYSELMREMWLSGNSHYAVPASIISNIKYIYPAFRGCCQQDTQEFLRCFLEQLHDELKKPVPVIRGKRKDSISSSSSTTTHTNNTTTTQVDDTTSQVIDTTTTTQTSDTNFQTDDTTTLLDQITNDDCCQQDSNTNIDTSTSDSKLTKPKPIDDTNSRSIITDTFEFKISSSVVCSCCNNISTTIETFKDLSIPIVTYPTQAPSMPIPSTYATVELSANSANNHQFHQSEQSSSSSDSSSDESDGQQVQTSNSYLSYLPLARWFWSWLGYFNDWLWGPQVTLQDCLTIFFGTDPLEGDNEYSCEVCTKKNRGVKFLRISELPEILCIHFKRYESAGSAKITTHVSFPLTGLDLSQYMGENSRPQCTTYNLIACICHHGSALLTGHYTTYALNCYDNQWYEFDDQFVTSVETRQVENSEAYILFYERSTANYTTARLNQ